MNHSVISSSDSFICSFIIHCSITTFKHCSIIMEDSQILDDTFTRDPIRFPRDKRHRVRAFRYFIYTLILTVLWAYLKASYFDNYSPFTTPELDNRNALVGGIAASLAQLFYIVFGVFFLIKSIQEKERNDGFKIGSIIGFGLLILRMIFYYS